MDLDLLVLTVAAVLVLGITAVRISARLGLPSLLLYLGIGLLLGRTAIGDYVNDLDTALVLATLALAFILGNGGFTTDWAEVRPVIAISATLATLGVLISVTVTAGVAYALLDIDLRTAVLLGAVVGSTDAAATFSVLRRLPIRHRTRTLVEAESGFNDPPVIVLVTVVVSDAWNAANPWQIGGLIIYQLVVGALIGILVASVGTHALRRIALPTAGLYPVATLAIAFVAFALAGLAGSSGIMAIYIAGIVLGNAVLPHRQATAAFSSGLGWLAEVGLFVLLGLLATPHRLPEAFLAATIVGVGLTFVARPVSVFLCTAVTRMRWPEKLFVSWAGLRGAVPIVLATIPMSRGLESAERIFDVVFLLVVVFTLVQAPTLPWVARRTGVVDDLASEDLDVESAPLEDMDTSLLQFTVPADSKLHGIYTSDLRLPHGATLALIHRDRQLLTPTPHTTLRRGDHLMVAVPTRVEAATHERLRAIGQYGRLARWYEGIARRPRATPTLPVPLSSAVAVLAGATDPVPLPPAARDVTSLIEKRESVPTP